jgi:hypothetical protein
VTSGVLPTDVVTRNRRVADAALRPRTPVFTHGDLQVTHVIAGYGTDVDLDVIRACWSLRSLRAARWLIEHGFDPSSPGCEFDVLRSQLLGGTSRVSAHSAARVSFLVDDLEGPRSAMGIQPLAIERSPDLAEPLCAQLAPVRELVASIPAPRCDHRQHEDPALAQQVLIDIRIEQARHNAADAKSACSSLEERSRRRLSGHVMRRSTWPLPPHAGPLTSGSLPGPLP